MSRSTTVAELAMNGGAARSASAIFSSYVGALFSTMAMVLPNPGAIKINILAS
jgi:hypothetical protein